MSDFILETKDLSKRYGQQLAANNISLQVRRNTVYGLLGPNGAGKSTTMKMLIGIIRPTSGGHSGLGLYIVKQLVEQLHGTVQIKNSPTGGACVVFYHELRPVQ